MLELKKESYYIEELNKIKNKCKILSIIRGILALNFIAWLLYFISEIKIVSLIISIISIIICISFILATDKYYKDEIKLNNIIKIYKLHYRRRNYDFNALIDDGYEFIDKNNYMINDLNIFGKKSLYQFLNQAKTLLGRKKFANQLINPNDKSDLYKNAIIELGYNEDTLLLESVINNLDNKERNLDYSIFNNLKNYKVKFSKILVILNLLSFTLSIISLFLTIFNVINPIILIIFIMINIIVSNLYKCDLFSLDTSLYYGFCDKYLDIIDVINSLKFNDYYLVKLSNNIINVKDDLEHITKTFGKISSTKNTFVKILGNALIPYNLLVLYGFNKDIENIKSFEQIFDNVAEFEMLLSFSNIVKDTSIYTIGEVCDKIEVAGMIHPLVKNCIPNDYFQSGGVILTGSNMSGKTTFMRTLGINQILFNACKIVFANSYFAPNLKVFTSLRAQDELSDGISTFYAEILRMKVINENIKNENCLILVDEIFKGTNANDRIKASLMVIEKLNRYNQYFIISTHDYELCNSLNVINYHFNETYEDDKIKFDYKIKNGKCDSRNAMYLLKMANIVE